MSTEFEYQDNEDLTTIFDLYQVRFEVDDLPAWLTKFRNIGTEEQTHIICFNRHMVAGKRHVQGALQFAHRAFTSGEQIARSVEVEALLYAAGTRQTGLIGSFGIQKGMNECYLCLMPPQEKALQKIRDLVTLVDEEDWEEIPAEKNELLRKIFGITEAELGVTREGQFIDLILERVALLTINR